MAGIVSDPPPVPASTLAVDFRHGFRNGSLAVWVDGRPLVQERLRSRRTSKFLFVERRQGRVRRTVAVPPGRRTVTVRVRWGDTQRSETAVATFRQGRTRHLVARLQPITRSLSLEWR